MAKFELSIAPNYVQDWELSDAIRELFQNAIDQEANDPGNRMMYSYDPEEEVLLIGNKTSSLTTTSLLLGATTKADDKSAIGQFGEGYKLATLVLTRLGKKLVIYNYGEREVWRPRFVNSKRYSTQVLTFFIDKKYVWNSVPNQDLTFEISGITPAEYESIREAILFLQADPDGHLTSRGTILLDEAQAGNIYVNGLFVTKHPEFKMGYNFIPEILELDRDRKLVSDFDLSWEASHAWMELEGKSQERKYDYTEIALRLVNERAADVKYIRVDSLRNSRLISKAYTEFVEEHGEHAYPVVTHEDTEDLPENIKPIIVSEKMSSLIKNSPDFEEVERKKEPTLHEDVTEWLLEAEEFLPFETYEALRDILEKHNRY